MLGKSLVDDDWWIVDAVGVLLLVEVQSLMVCLVMGELVLNFVLGVYFWDGALRWFSVNSLLIFDKIGELFNLIVILFIDVIELCEREIELCDALELVERASWVKSQFVVNVSHEIRMSLNGVIVLVLALR